MKKSNILVVSLVLFSMCIEASQLKETENKNKQKNNIVQEYGKKCIGVCLGLCAVQALNAPMFQYRMCGSFDCPQTINQPSFATTLVQHTINIPMFLVCFLRDKFFWISVHDTDPSYCKGFFRGVAPLGCALICGYGCYKLIASCSCPKKEAEESAA